MGAIEPSEELVMAEVVETVVVVVVVAPDR